MPGHRVFGARAKRQPASTTHGQARHRRQQRRAFLQSRRGQKLYARRGQTVEPFNEWLKSLFELARSASFSGTRSPPFNEWLKSLCELEHRVWRRGLDNNRTQLLAAILAYQVLLRYNHRCGKENGQLRWILDML